MCIFFCTPSRNFIFISLAKLCLVTKNYDFIIPLTQPIKCNILPWLVLYHYIVVGCYWNWQWKDRQCNGQNKKEQRQTKIYKTLHRKLKIEWATETHKNTRGELVCFGSSCCDSDTHHVTVKRHNHHLTWKCCWTPVYVNNDMTAHPHLLQRKWDRDLYWWYPTLCANGSNWF